MPPPAPRDILPVTDVLPVTLGTAGHIDHGKTTLLRALAGDEQDTDRLAEERARGLTIDIGYAELRLGDDALVGVVDVPGHERFIRNMVAGATGIDVVMLVVAADDGVMPQTREHLQIMSLLGLASGVVAITKSDTVDAEMVELVASEVEDLVAGTFLEGARMLPVSAVSGDGLDALRTELARLVADAPRRDVDGYFRMPVLRVFTSEGFGTVVTGIPSSGRVEVGARLHMLPGERPCRVRGLQVYHRPAERAEAGHRTAMNLTDVDRRRVRRGDVVCEPGILTAAEVLDVRLEVLDTHARPLRHNSETRLHVGATECAARVLLVGRKQLAPGERGWAQLKLDRPVVIAPGDRFILRTPSHVATIGGGTVLGQGSLAQRRRSKGRHERFAERERGLHDVRVAVVAHVRRAGVGGCRSAELTRATLRRPEELAPIVDELVAAGTLARIDRDRLCVAELVAATRSAILKALERFHAKRPLEIGMRKASLGGLVRTPQPVVDAMVGELIAAGEIEDAGSGLIRRAGSGPSLSAEQQARTDRILDELRREPWQTPRAGALPALIGALPAETDQLLAILEHRGDIARLSDGILFLSESIDDAKTRIREHVGPDGTLTPAVVRELFGISRKYGIPLLEHLDRIGFTRRDGDVRRLRDVP